MTWSFVGIVTDVRATDNPPSCLVRNEQTGGDAWYRIAPQVAPSIRVGEWVRVIGGGDPDELSATYPEPQVVGRVEPPIPMPAATAVKSPDNARPPAPDVMSPPNDPSVWDRASIIQVQHIDGGVRVRLIDPSGNIWSVDRLDAIGWTAGDGEAPRILTTEAYAALDALVAVYRLALIHL
jgi:hypothetical protein